MKKKLSQKEREEVVTKGFLSDYLDSKNYITKDYLDSKNYITKDYLEDYLDMRFKKQTLEFKQYLDSLMEHQMHQLQILMEQMDERYVLRREWISARGV